jgi:hypothetical protein
MSIVLCGNPIDALVHVIFVGHIHHDAERLAASRGDHPRNRIRAVQFQIRNGDGGTGLHQGPCDFLTDAAGCAGNDRCFSVPIAHDLGLSTTS